MIEFKIFIIFACAALFSWGGYNFIEARRYIMPALLTVGCLWFSHSWWAFTILPVIGTLCLGYSIFGSGNLSRAIWLGIQALVIGLGLTITGHIAWFLYIPYIAIAAVLSGLLNNRLKQPISDAIFGGWLGLIVLAVH